ncbi:HD-GYP domain-containing protein [Paenibacillus sp.]|uniref:HD-GYP domain-containing protein n=1 Tax=Paenibacillus sp. TaxID=58172 RepID=UPI0028127B41|nr:HD-GYP domain-containing protein [Paenibacillus sp.]
MRYRSMIGPIAVMLASYGAFAWLRGTPFDLSLSAPSGHFYVVSVVSLLAAGIAFAVGIAGARLRNTKVTFLSLAFLSLAVIFSVHGLSTPHFLIHPSQLPSISSPLSLIFATFWLFMSSLSADHPWVQYFSRRQASLLPSWTVGLIGVGMLLMLRPELVAFIPLTAEPVNWSVASATVLLLGTVMVRYYRSYLYSRFPLQLAIVYSSALIIVSQLIMVQGELWRASWWLYHFLLLASMISMLVGLVKQYSGSGSLTSAFRALYTTDAVERVTSAISPSIKAFMIATEKKDPYTAGHNLRVTLYALKLGEEMGLRPDRQRALAQGTIIHDVGKIEVPDAILNKPGRLTDEERAVIELHPVKGYEMCRELGFMKDELEIIRWHHERWDGRGYPDRLAGERIPLLARIVAVADVYDALTSHRAYRKAMTHEAAMAILAEQRGSHFDPACVDAWTRLCERERASFPIPSEGEREATAALSGLSPA